MPRGVGYRGRANVGRGAPGLKKGSRLDTEIQGLSDVAKQKKRAKAAEANAKTNIEGLKRGKKPKTIAERKTSKVDTPKLTKEALKFRARRLRIRAQKMDKAGNKNAAKAFRDAADFALKRVADRAGKK